MTEAVVLPDADAAVTLRAITAETPRSILDLKVWPEQERFVAPNAVSIAPAHFEPKAWFRAIYAGGTPVRYDCIGQRLRPAGAGADHRPRPRPLRRANCCPATSPPRGAPATSPPSSASSRRALSKMANAR